MTNQNFDQRFYHEAEKRGVVTFIIRIGLDSQYEEYRSDNDVAMDLLKKLDPKLFRLEWWVTGWAYGVIGKPLKLGTFAEAILALAEAESKKDLS
jgi:hypothetical protein